MRNLRGDGVKAEIKKHENIIRRVAVDQQVDPRLIKAIIYEEMTHQLPGENTLELFGAGNTFGLGQVTEGYFGYSAKELWNPKIGIYAIGRHLNNLQSQPLINHDRPVESIATKYNCGGCSEIRDYGKRVRSYMSYF
ncbi:MAG: hypothetical protein R3E62_10025 [Pseudomonadales bacterium]